MLSHEPYIYAGHRFAPSLLLSRPVPSTTLYIFREFTLVCASWCTRLASDDSEAYVDTIISACRNDMLPLFLFMTLTHVEEKAEPDGECCGELRHNNFNL